MKPPQSSDSEMCDVNPESNNSTPSFTPNSSSSSSDIPCQHDSKDSLPDGGHVSHLLLLPPEIIQKICSYIDARFLLNTVSVVCKAFHQLLSQDVTWKIRSSRKCCKQYPVIPGIQFYCLCQMEKFPMTISYNPECQGQIWIGEKTGLLHLMDARDGVFDIVKTYDVGHTGKLTGILHNLGCLVTCSYDKTVKIHEPNDDPETICTLLEHDGEVADIDMQNNVLVSGSSDMTVHVWRPTKSIYNEDTNEACGVSEDAPKLDTELYAPTQSD
ncbi:uncharacterized protein LOC144348387 [Saccoglossus kowalevskii]